jgi:hypothetical protein
LIVGCDLLGPEHLWRDTEHCPAVQHHGFGLKQMQLEGADREHRLGLIARGERENNGKDADEPLSRWIIYFAIKKPPRP